MAKQKDYTLAQIESIKSGVNSITPFPKDLVDALKDLSDLIQIVEKLPALPKDLDSVKISQLVQIENSKDDYINASIELKRKIRALMKQYELFSGKKLKSKKASSSEEPSNVTKGKIRKYVAHKMGIKGRIDFRKSDDAKVARIVKELSKKTWPEWQIEKRKAIKGKEYKE